MKAKKLLSTLAVLPSVSSNVNNFSHYSRTIQATGQKMASQIRNDQEDKNYATMQQNADVAKGYLAF